MIAYLINQYPQSSQSFIRREILALEKLGQPIERFTLRRWPTKLVDPGDIAEQQKTRVVLEEGPIGVLLAVFRAVFHRPLSLLRTCACAIRAGWHSERGVLVHLIYVAESCVLREWFRKANITHVHCHFGTNSTTVAMLVHQLGGPPFSFTLHGPEEWESPRFLSIPEKIHRCAFVATISNFGRSQAYLWSDYRDWDKVQVIHCGLDDQFLAAPKTAPSVEPRLVCVGRFGEAKGHLILLQAAAKLAAEGVAFELSLIGDGTLRPAIEAMIAEHKLQDRVKLLGWRSNQEVLEAIRNSRALVMPSFSEGLPVVFMESLAMQRPVIATYIAGVPELVQPGISGWLVPAGTIDPLVDAMREALTLPVERLWEMGKAGAKIVEQNHTATTEAAKLLDLFRHA